MDEEIKHDGVNAASSLKSTEQLKSVDRKDDDGERKNEVCNSDGIKAVSRNKPGYSSRSNSVPLTESDKDIIRLDPGAWAVHDNSKIEQLGIAAAEQEEKDKDAVKQPRNLRQVSSPGKAPRKLGDGTRRRRQVRRASEPLSKSVTRDQGYLALGNA